MSEYISYVSIVPELIEQLGANFGIFIGPIALFALLVAIYFFFWRSKKFREAKISPKELKKGISKLDKLSKKTKDD